MRLNGIVYTLAMQIDGDAHERLMTIHTAKDAITSPKQDQDYFAIHQVLRRNVQANMLNTAIYTIVLDSSNTCYFGVLPMKSLISAPYHRRHCGALSDELGSPPLLLKVGQMVALVGDKSLMIYGQARAEVLQNLLVGVLTGTFLVLLIRILQPILRKERLNKEALSAANRENNVADNSSRVWSK
ncbi:MAG: hypothetical protein IPL27_21255 [Lewinellaceae bacterium]|nr:hypothetical protein [Lewinellaceae bacterium]